MMQSILGAPFEDADAVVIGIPYEHTASYGSGTRHGPEKVKEVLDEQIELYDRFLDSVPCEEYKYGFTMLNVQDLSPEKMVKKVSTFLELENRFFVLVGGEHSISIPAFTALSKKYKAKNTTILQIDAHFDLRDDDSEYNKINPSKCAHSTVMRRASEIGYNILSVGIRTMFEDEHTYAKNKNIKYFEWGRVDIKKPSVQEIIDSITTDNVYLTIDVDGFDPSVMPGTGTPVPGGLSWEYGQDLIREIMKQKNVLSADIVEISPVENSGQTETAAGQLVYEILALYSHKNS